jgi:hypothetical protein
VSGRRGSQAFLGRDEEAISWLRRSVEANRAYPLPHFYLAIAFAHQSKISDANKELETGLAIDPGFTICRYRKSSYSDHPTYLAQRERMYEGLRKAGLPE